MTSTRAATLVLAGTVGLLGLGVGTTLGPGVASAATAPTPAASSTAPSTTPSTAPRVGLNRVSTIKTALAGLVKDGTLTQKQVDQVASTLDTALPKGGPGHGGFGGPGGFGPGAGLDTAAGIIGVSADELRTALEGGQTLAQVAQGKGVSQATLVDRLVSAAKTRLAAAVTAGRLTQAQADAISADLPARITQEVTSTRPADGRGHRGDGWGGVADGGAAPAGPSASPSSSTSTS